jgi:hypothetical protein
MLRPAPPVIISGVLSAARTSNKRPRLFYLKPSARIRVDPMSLCLWAGKPPDAGLTHIEHLCVPRVCTAVITKSHKCLHFPTLPCYLISKVVVPIVQWAGDPVVLGPGISTPWWVEFKLLLLYVAASTPLRVQNGFRESSNIF